MDIKSYCTTLGVGIGGGIGVSKMFKFYIKVFYVTRKVLSGELSFRLYNFSPLNSFKGEEIFQ